MMYGNFVVLIQNKSEPEVGMCDCCSQDRNIQIIVPDTKKGKGGGEDSPKGAAPEAR
jgi:hypothetical protein